MGNPLCMCDVGHDPMAFEVDCVFLGTPFVLFLCIDLKVDIFVMGVHLDMLCHWLYFKWGSWDEGSKVGSGSCNRAMMLNVTSFLRNFFNWLFGGGLE